VLSATERPQYHSVTLNSSVATLDGQRIGVISEVRGQLFKIKTGRFHRDFWLRVDSVRSSEPEQSVVLNVNKLQLDDIKMVDPELG
jgi:hypothetical protein